ncbi:MAG: hypothetical protein IT381_19815 [Deltaproteobacteria bacterium]|nr:hypothetical protein [Deltaproteobacteria bacterium]
MEKRDRFLRYGAWGALLTVITVLSIETGGAPLRYLRHPAALIALAVAVGYGIFSRSKAKKGQPEPQRLEGLPTVNMILRIAKEHKGRITAAEVLAETTLDLEEVKRTLDELAYAGACQLIVSEKGTQVYYFAEFEDATTKATDALDTSDLSAAQKQAAKKSEKA